MTKNPLKDFDWEDYHSLLNQALNDEVHIVHNFNKDNPKGGQTFVWARESDFKNCRMIRVSVSFCHKNDQFCKKIGTYNALSSWYTYKEQILLPVGNEDSAVIVRRLREIFDYAGFVTLY